MTREEIEDLYFKYMCHLATKKKKKSYHKLLTQLHQTEFTFIFKMDENRAYDGIDLRYRFAYDLQLPDSLVSKYLDIRPCSVLEMMLALAARCEDNIMTNPEKGDRTSVWFWEMITSLGLSRMTDNNYDERYVDTAIQKFLNREYEPNGKGGLFTIHGATKDLRDVEIWYQMCWYLNTIT